jgi:hypothetical protein
MKTSNPPIYILSEDDFDSIVTLTEHFKMALYEFIDSRRLDPVSPMESTRGQHFFETADKMIWDALGDDNGATDLF